MLDCVNCNQGTGFKLNLNALWIKNNVDKYTINL